MRKFVSNKMNKGFQKRLFSRLKFKHSFPALQPTVEMPAMTKSALFEKIQEYGETPPLHWKKNQLEARLNELKEEHGHLPNMELKSMMAALNRAAKKKADLQHHVETVLQKKITGQETIPKLLALGNQAILEKIDPTSQDLMGFGKHSDKTYLEVLAADAQYVEWCMTTSKEEQVNWRMARFLKWVKMYEEQSKSPSKVMSPSPKKFTTPQKGYRGTMSAMGGGSSSEQTDGSYQMVAVPMSSDDELTPEQTVEKLEAQIQELKRQQALQRKSPAMKVDHEEKSRKVMP